MPENSKKDGRPNAKSYLQTSNVMRSFVLNRNALSSPQPLDVNYVVVERHLEDAAARASGCCVAAAVGLFLGAIEI
jgi:hypothetical protein